MRDLLHAFVLALLALTAAPAFADDDVEQFYKGKTLQVTSAFAEGGLYTAMARLVAQHLPRHLPGQPNAITQSLPGAAGLRQMNHLYNVAPKDGTVIAVMYDNAPASQVMQADDSVKFDARRFQALGSLGRGETGLVGVLKRTGVTTLDDARRKSVVFGATGTSSGQYYVPNIMNKLFGTRFQIIPGFKTTAEQYLAMDRGELDGMYGAIEPIVALRPQWISESRFTWLAQMSDVRPPQFQDVPLLQELAQRSIDKEAFKFLAMARVAGKIVLAPPEVPPARLAALRRAFETMVRDEAFIADVARTSQRLEPRTWQDAQRIIRETVDTPPEVVEHVRDLLKVN